MKWLKLLYEFLSERGIHKKAIEFCNNGELGCSIFVGCSEPGISYSFEFYDDTCEGDEMIANIFKGEEKQQIGWHGSAEYVIGEIKKYIV